MKHYDIAVIGSGCGANIVEEAIGHGFNIALIDKGPLGGTCLNLGCIPSKMLIYPADRIMDIEESRKFGIETRIESVDFLTTMERMRSFIKAEQHTIRQNITEIKNLDLYESTAQFTGDYTLEATGETILADKIFIASGSRIAIPAIKGLDKAEYLTSDTILQLRERPESLIIIGGGYISVEYAHFFAAMGTRVTILEALDRLVANEEPEVSRHLKKELAKRMDIYTNVVIEEVNQNGSAVIVSIKDKITGKQVRLTAARLMVATGRRSNADLLKVEKTGVVVNEKGFIVTNEFMETTRESIWAIGDAAGKQMFTHVSNEEAVVAAHNALHGENKIKMDYNAVPHAVFSRPQIASVGMTEEQARKEHKVLIGFTKYSDVAKGEAMMESEAFAKAIVDKESELILGFHIIGPEASVLIQEVVNAMASGGDLDDISSGMHIHPALSELIPRTFSSLVDV